MPKRPKFCEKQVAFLSVSLFQKTAFGYLGEEDLTVFQHKKVQSVAKKVVPQSAGLQAKVLDTMKDIASIVGATLGPGGRAVLIERQENSLPPIATKDGVTVFRSLGFTDPVAQTVMEAAREASVKTADQAGDGTTTSTVLAYNFVKRIHTLTNEGPTKLPQNIIADLQKIHDRHVQPLLANLARPANLAEEAGQSLLKQVAALSANGDEELAQAVIDSFLLVGDCGNVTIAEATGTYNYKVERVEGFPISTGYEDHVGKFFPKFITDTGRNTVRLEDPVFILFHGSVDSIEQVVGFFNNLTGLAASGDIHSKNFVLVACGFGNDVVSSLAFNFERGVRIYPVQAPPNVLPTGQLDFLQDLSIISGAKIIDPIKYPSWDQIDPREVCGQMGPTMFEAFRYKAVITGRNDETAVEMHVQDIETRIETAASQLEQTILKERLGKITEGIAKVTVVGNSTVEVKERRDRVEDAVCAVKGAMKHGVLPGGCKALLHVAATEPEPSLKTTFDAVFKPAVLDLYTTLLENAGIEFVEELASNSGAGDFQVYDIRSRQWGDALELGILDSVPAVADAVKNAISVASLLGTLGGVVVFERDPGYEKEEARSREAFMSAGR